MTEEKKAPDLAGIRAWLEADRDDGPYALSDARSHVGTLLAHVSDLESRLAKERLAGARAALDEVTRPATVTVGTPGSVMRLAWDMGRVHASMRDQIAQVTAEKADFESRMDNARTAHVDLLADHARMSWQLAQVTAERDELLKWQAAYREWSDVATNLLGQIAGHPDALDARKGGQE